MIKIFASVGAFEYDPIPNHLISDFDGKTCTIFLEEGGYHIDIQPDAFGQTVSTVDEMLDIVKDKFGIEPESVELGRLK